MRAKGTTMKATQQLHALGQSLWLDNITREMLVNGTLRRYIDDFEITGLTSNPTIFDRAIRNGHFYDASIRRRAAAGQDRKSTRLNSSHMSISYAVFCLK